MKTVKRFWRRYLLWAVVLLLLGWILSRVPISEIVTNLRQLSAGQLALIAGLNALIVVLLSSRWWLFLRAQGYRAPYHSLIGYRLAGFAVSYFTPGPQIGGEPLQVYLVRSRDGIPTSAAIAAVSLDKLVELIANFTFIAASLLLGLRYSLGSELPVYPMIALFIGMLAMPVGYLALLWSGRRPLSLLAQRLTSRGRGIPPAWRSRLRTVGASEDKMADLFRRKPGYLLAGLLFSLLIWACIILEYRLTLLFLGQPVSWPAVIFLLTAARIAFLLPSPGGLGTLEASQVLAMTSLGLSPALALSVSLLIRARDVFFSSLGLWLGAYLAQKNPGEALQSQAGD